MPPIYGAIETTRQDPATLDNVTNSRTPLLASSSRSSPDEEVIQKGVLDGTAQMAGCIGNLSNTLLGTGLLAFPMAMASGGLIPGIFTCVFSGATAGLGLWFLSRCAAQCPPRRSSFFAVAQLTYPSFSVLIDAAIAIKCFGVSISYLIIIKGLMPSVVRSLHYVSHSKSELPWWIVSGHFWITVLMSILVPLCFLKRLDSLRHTSYVALFSVVYVVIIVVACHFRPPEGSAEPGEWHLVHFTPSFISNFPVQVFAFTCAQNLFPIYNELASNTQERMNFVIGSSIGGAMVTYEVMLSTSKVAAEFGPFAQVGPDIVHPCRNCLDKALALPDEDDDDVSVHGPATNMSELKHVVLTSGIIIAGFTIAYFVDNLQMVLSFVGSTGSTTITLILPGLFYYKLFGTRPDHPRRLKWASVGLTIYGFVIFVFCLTYNIWTVSRNEEPGPHIKSFLV
ncbi:transmembrane amino acid transporter protein-domain-containing protein [Cantharellus anzutake]|uniref:transmembrane amino acid transporter protein-domain-containing protein n=1 Tax=Cantharellus anzutake TaxID=1750568 RepID=UPI0019065E55|nr:transmembrane amino acid transporter protein-domain-containing protein [Cantharellus anzutake]KAF8327211.1 transmembrane amino acid transporter protein-domain-containing protein [Cantharellus anzutake]